MIALTAGAGRELDLRSVINDAASAEGRSPAPVGYGQIVIAGQASCGENLFIDIARVSMVSTVAPMSFAFITSTTLSRTET